MQRSRTGLFLSYRDSIARSSSFKPSSNYADDDENQQLIANHVALDVLMPQLPPKWVDISDEVNDILASTEVKIHSLDKLHAKHILPGFSDRSQEEREIEALTTDITQDFRRCQSLIQKVVSSPHVFPPDPQKSRHEALAGKNVQRGLAAKVQDLSATFRKKQRVYMERLQGHATKNQDLLIASGAISLRGSDGMNAVDDDIQAASHTRAQSQSLVLAEPPSELQARDRELMEIAKSIASLAELFKDLSVLVIDQGTLLDSVEFNIEQTAVQMEDAVMDLDVATRYQKSTGRRKCIFLLMLLIFGLVITLIFKPKRHYSSPPPPRPSPSPVNLSLPLIFIILVLVFLIVIPRPRTYHGNCTIGSVGAFTRSKTPPGLSLMPRSPYIQIEDKFDAGASVDSLNVIPGTVPILQQQTSFRVRAQGDFSVSIQARNPFMSYPPQRPPVEHLGSEETYTPNQGEGFPLKPVHNPSFDAERGASHSPHDGPHKLKKSGWLRKESEQGYESEFEHRNPSQSNLIGQHNDDASPITKLGRLYNYLLTVSIITRWIIFILPILGILWIPGILSLTAFPNATIWSVKLIWWSIWLSVVWGGWWAALAVSRILPVIIRSTVGAVAVSTRRYIDWMQALHRYNALFAWTLAVWISFHLLIVNHQRKDATAKSIQTVALILKVLFGIYVCSAVLLFEKFAIQWIAGKFHERSYAERIADQKLAVKVLVTLYKHSADIPGRSDTLQTGTAKGYVDPKRIFKKLRAGVHYATTTTATVFGNVASEIAGSTVLQPNSPQATIKTVLESANKSRLLARRLFYSFAKTNPEYLLVEDVEQYFSTKEEAAQAFALFDKDGNGDASREEVEMACLEFHREQLSIENSMRDLDSAVGRLDNIFMSLYVIIAVLIIAIVLEAQLLAVVTGAGTLILGLSWLIGGSLQEVLSSIIFLFVKHPFDVGDRVVINSITYTVKEIRLLSTVFLDSNSTQVQAPNNQLNTLFIQNFRRSPQMSETFVFDVNYSTTFEDLEKLREKMLHFVTTERRDYQPVFDVIVKDFPEQTKMTLSADIKYKSNFQLGALKAKRRNKWICALKTILADLKVYGPIGDPNPPPNVARYTQVPWTDILAEDKKASAQMPHDVNTQIPSSGWRLSDKNAAIHDSADDVFGDSAELQLTSPRRGYPETGPAGPRRTGAPATTIIPSPSQHDNYTRS